nr:hypothetical protein [Tanacetum cinerariifolium]
MNPSTIATITTSRDAPIPPTTIPSIILENLPTFNSAFRFDERLRSLKTTFFEYRQTNPFVDVVSAIPADLSEIELKKILIEKMEGNKSIQRSDEQRNLYKAEDDDQEGPSAGSDRGSKILREGGEHASASTLSETATGRAGRSTTGRPPLPDRDWNKTLPAAQGDAQLWISNLASLTKLEYHLEEVYKATTDQLDWVNPEGQQYPHDLLQPPDNRGRQVIPFEHFINNDLEYLWGGASSQKYITFVTKTKAADYGHIKWIEYLVPRAMWIQEPINYDRHALWGVSHWGQKR